MTTVPVPAAGLSEEDVFLGLPPELVKADKIAIVYYSFTTGLYCWDLLVTLDQDYYLVVKDRKRIRPLTVAYLVARYTILVFLVLSLLFQTTHIPDCQAMIVAIGAMYGLAQPLIASIFIARTVAVWNRNKYVIATGAAFWLLILGWSFAVPFGLFAGRIPGSKFCTNTAAKPWLTGSLASTMSNDFVMLVLLVVKIAADSNLTMKDLATYATNPSFSRFKSPEDEKKGLNLPAFTTFLVRQGILYWLITLVFHIIGLVFLASPKVNPILHTTNVNLLAAIEMAMAGRIFRGTRTWVKEHVNKNLLLQSKRPTSRENSSPQPGRRQSNNSASAATEVGERPLSALEKGGAGEDYDRDELSEEAASTYRGTGKNFTSDDTFVIGRSPSVTSGTATVVGDTPRLGGTTKDVWASFTTSTTSPRQPSLFDLRQGRDDAERRQYDRDSLHDSAPRWSASRTMTTRTDLPPAQVAPSWHVHTTRRNENTLSGGSFEKRLSFGSNAPSLGGGKRFGLGIFEKQAGAESNSDPSSPPSPPQPLQHSISISTLRAKAEAEASSVIGPSNPRSLTSKLQHKDVLEGGAVDIAGPIAQTFEEYKAEPPKEHRYTSKGTPRYQGPFGSPDADSGRGASMDGASLRSDGEVGDGRFELAVVTPNLPPRSTVQSITSEDEEDGCEEERRGKGESGEGWTNKVKSPSQLTFGSKKSDSMTRSDPGGGSGGGWV